MFAGEHNYHSILQYSAHYRRQSISVIRVGLFGNTEAGGYGDKTENLKLGQG